MSQFIVSPIAKCVAEGNNNWTDYQLSLNQSDFIFNMKLIIVINFISHSLHLLHTCIGIFGVSIVQGGKEYISLSISIYKSLCPRIMRDLLNFNIKITLSSSG